MKFLVTASTAALSCLFLLVSAAPGEYVYACGDSDLFTIKEAQNYAVEATPNGRYESDPDSSGHDVLRAHHFCRVNKYEESGYYVVRAVKDRLALELWKYVDGRWMPCPILSVDS
ncbi:CSEP0099 putative effector protein [Blumeria hordei DH14]|uniref:CSEP0099 putative effector protein n=1 Tax=Blumeria graminis f. sp. hordei (strain DH14) TaxID=546991 RepID=N1JII8_BLUG1|nr:CSEP0099 putative effector protein [Blumeria hordei DH14]